MLLEKAQFAAFKGDALVILIWDLRIEDLDIPNMIRQTIYPTYSLLFLKKGGLSNSFMA